MAPPKAAASKKAFAVYVSGDSMEPRYEAGEVVFVLPGIPLHKGCYVVAQIKGEEGDAPDAYVKRYLSWDSKRLRLEQLNPRKIIEFSSDSVVSVDKIIMGGEE